MIQSLLPTTFATNWYITCYILFYFVHLMLNKIIDYLSQRELLSVSVGGLILYFGFGYLKGDLFFASPLILFTVIYFSMAYIKIYMKNFLSMNKRINIGMLVIGVCGTPIMILFTNFMGLHFTPLYDQLTRWDSNASPFFLIVAIAAFNLIQRKKFINRFLNNVSSLSLLIYIIHENLLLRTYVRPKVWIWVYEHFGYSHVILWVLIIAVIIFILSIVISALYKLSLQKIVYSLADRLYAIYVGIYGRVINAILTIK